MKTEVGQKKYHEKFKWGNFSKTSSFKKVKRGMKFGLCSDSLILWFRFAWFYRKEYFMFLCNATRPCCSK